MLEESVSVIAHTFFGATQHIEVRMTFPRNIEDILIKLQTATLWFKV